MYSLSNSIKKIYPFYYSSILLLVCLISFSAKTTAQITDSLGKENTNASSNRVTVPDMVASKMENEMKVTYENGIRIVGEKTFDIEIKDGSFYVNKIKGELGEDAKRALGISSISPSDVIGIFYTNLNGVGKIAHVVFKKEFYPLVKLSVKKSQ